MVTTHAQAGGRVRSSAHAGADAPSGPLRLTAPRQHGRLLGLHTGQLVTLEIAALAVVASLRGPLALTAAVGAAAAIVVLLTLGRSRGRWLYQSYLAGRRLRRRRAARRPDGHPDPRLAGLRELAPDLAVTSTEERGGRIGIARDGAGWFAAIEVAAARGVRVQARPAVPLERLGALLEDGAVPLSALQVVVHTVPAPVAGLPADSAALASYRSLAGAGEALPPADEVTWIVVRLHAADAADAARSRGGGVDGVHRALAAGLGRVGQILTSAHVPYDNLDADGLIDALARSCGIGGRGLSFASGEPRTDEERRSWHADGSAHISYWVQSWPQLEATAPVLDQLSRVPAAVVTVSTVLTPSRDGVDVQGVVRVTAEPSEVEQTGAALRATARALKFGLRRQNGEQAPAVYASAPTGGGPA